MPKYVLGHHLRGEGKRLALMSELLDPMHRRCIESLDVVKPGAHTLEVGCGNGSISACVAEPPGVRAFWDGWLAWSRERGIDYYVGRTLAPRLAALGLTQISGTAETAIYNGGSPWAKYWIQTITELRDDLIDSRKLDNPLVDKFLEHCADPSWWTQTIAFTAVRSRAPAV